MVHAEVGMKTITPVYQGLTNMVNRAYKFHTTRYFGGKYVWGDTKSFQRDLLTEFGISLQFEVKEGSGGKGYELTAVEVYDERKYSMFLLRWS